MKKKHDKMLIITILIISLILSITSIIVNIKSLSVEKTLDNEIYYEVSSSKVMVYTTLSNNQSFEEDYGSRQVSLRYGKNSVPIKIISPTSTDEYYLSINRVDDRSSEARLKDIVISNQEIDFKKDKYTYNISVASNVNSLNINATLLDTSASFVDDYGPRSVDIQEGLNVIFLKTKAESGEEKSYKINVFKNSDDIYQYEYTNNLESLSFSCAQIDFQEDVYEYKTTTECESIDVYAFASNPNYIVNISGSQNLEVGANIISIKISDKSTLVNEYTINVERQESKKVIDTSLQDLKIAGYELDFQQDVYEYNLKVKSNNNIIVMAYVDEDTNINILENEQEEDHNIEILVGDDAQNLTTYIIHLEDNNWNCFLEIFIVFISFIVSLLGIIIVLYVIKIRRKTKRNKNKKKSK